MHPVHPSSLFLLFLFLSVSVVSSGMVIVLSFFAALFRPVLLHGLMRLLRRFLHGLFLSPSFPSVLLICVILGRMMLSRLCLVVLGILHLALVFSPPVSFLGHARQFSSFWPTGIFLHLRLRRLHCSPSLPPLLFYRLHSFFLSLFLSPQLLFVPVFSSPR